ncbi:MAG: hypothetical protein RMM98_08395 [Acidobacteriota bacterium]|nr:hypothetical protein [Blastocatellia bacterium]MDW8239621.1 hypothetical protein [Acidobacteriota bacterium]
MPNKRRGQNSFSFSLLNANSAVTEHPSLERLVAFRGSNLAPEEQESIEQHLLQCHLCNSTAHEISQLLDHFTTGMLPHEIIQQWEQNRRRLPLDQQAGADAAALHQPGLSSRRRAPRGFVTQQRYRRTLIVFSLLLGLLLALVGYQWWMKRKVEHVQAQAEQRIARLWTQVQELEQQNQVMQQTKSQEINQLNEKLKQYSGPWVNWPVFDLFSSTFLRQSGGPRAVNQIELPKTATGFHLILNPESRSRFELYRAEIVDDEGQIVWQTDELQRNRLETFNLTIHRELLPKQRYTIRVYGKSGTRLSPVGEFPFMVKQIE